MKSGPVIPGMIAIAVLVIIVIMMTGYHPSPPDASDVRDQYEDELLAMPGITGICTYPQTNEIGVMVENQSAAAAVPGTIEGCKVRVMVTGRLTMYDGPTAQAISAGAGSGPDAGVGAGDPNQPVTTALPLNLTTYVTTITRNGTDRPVVGGISIGSADFPISAGTLGLVVKDPSGNNLYVLSCAHVLALTSRGTFAPEGTPIWQPGGYNAGTSADRIGVLERYTPISFFRSGVNYADAGIARLEVGGLPYVVVDSANQTFYTINGTTNVTTGDVIRKSGITTGVTTGEVLATDAVGRIFVTEQSWALFRDQIVTDALGAPGDSGSAVDMDGKFVGLYFAGSDTNGVVCKAQYIVGPLGITV